MAEVREDEMSATYEVLPQDCGEALLVSSTIEYQEF